MFEDLPVEYVNAAIDQPGSLFSGLFAEPDDA
jgi:hypothetical protein